MAKPDKVWVGDIAHIATDEGWLFLAVAIDLFSRQVVGWSLRHDLTSNIVINALRMAWFKRYPVKHAVVLFHSHQTSQLEFNEYGISCSMSRRGNCLEHQCLQRDAVQLVEGRVPAQATLCDPAPGQE